MHSHKFECFATAASALSSGNQDFATIEAQIDEDRERRLTWAFNRIIQSNGSAVFRSDKDHGWYLAHTIEGMAIMAAQKLCRELNAEDLKDVVLKYFVELFAKISSGFIFSMENVRVNVVKEFSEATLRQVINSHIFHTDVDEYFILHTLSGEGTEVAVLPDQTYSEFMKLDQSWRTLYRISDPEVDNSNALLAIKNDMEQLIQPEAILRLKARETAILRGITETRDGRATIHRSPRVPEKRLLLVISNVIPQPS